MHIALITTTINNPVVLEEYAAQAHEQDVALSFVVAGDRKTPHDAVNALLFDIQRKYGFEGDYLHPSDQEFRWKALSDVVGWDTIQRRNFAILTAIADTNAEWIFTIDDDNAPEPDFFTKLKAALDFEKPNIHLVKDDGSGFFNPGGVMNQQHYSRGYPYSLRKGDPSKARGQIEPVSHEGSVWKTSPAIFQCFTKGDPDINATERLEVAPNVYGFAGDGAIIAHPSLVFSPLNTQATLYRMPYAGLLGLPPGLGRYDDIWQGYAAQAVLSAEIGAHIAYGEPWVIQERNEHNLFKDLRAELIGMEHTEKFCAALRESVENTGRQAPVDKYRAAWAGAIVTLWDEPFMQEPIQQYDTRVTMHERRALLLEFISLWTEAAHAAFEERKALLA